MITSFNKGHFLNDRALKNSMKFHPLKCKALIISKAKMLLVNILPFVQFHYSLGQDLVVYFDSEKDLGIHMNGSLNFTEHSDIL